MASAVWPRLSASWASSTSLVAASFQRDADLGDHALGGVELVLLELEPGELHQGGRVLGLFGDRPAAAIGLWSKFLSDSAWIWARIMTSVALSGPAARNRPGRSASAGLPSLVEQGGIEPGQIGCRRDTLAEPRKPRPGLGLLALLLESQDGELLGRGASLSLSH